MRGFCFTLNNPKSNGGKLFVQQLQEISSYGVIGFERAPTTNTPHYQGYVCLPDNYNLKMLKPLNNAVAWFRANGTWEQNKTYCTKSSLKPPLIWGKEPQQGDRTDLKTIVEAVRQGLTKSQISIMYPQPYIRYHAGIDKLIEAHAKHRDANGPPPTVYWLYGDTGTGKSRYAFDRWSQEQIYIMDASQDWTGYEQSEVILIDDFEEGCIGFRQLLRLLDRYPLSKNKKFGSVRINSQYIIITSEHHPRYCFPSNNRDNVDQLIRRIDKIVHFQTSKKPHVLCRPKKVFNLTQRIDDGLSEEAVDEAPRTCTCSPYMAYVCGEGDEPCQSRGHQGTQEEARS